MFTMTVMMVKILVKTTLEKEVIIHTKLNAVKLLDCLRLLSTSKNTISALIIK